jgi:membrane-bound lytic murein transglycosylase D
MMEKIFKSLFLTLLFSALFQSAIADDPKKIGQYVMVSLDTAGVQTIYLEPDEIGRAVFSEKLDDLVSSWYVNNIFLSGTSLDLDFTLHRHIDLPDSVLIRRLQKAEAAVKLSYNSVVRDYIEMYTTRRPGQVEIMLGLSAYYFPFFEEIFDKYELPHELKYMAIIESALNPRARSRAGAVGLWQFMLGTAKGLNLEVTTFIDERTDVLKATDAAARYLKQLYDVYQDWHLVIAAYNCGPGNVNKAITRAGGKTDYWQIYYALPRETRGYVPAFIAAAYVMNYYREHQLTPRYPAMALNTDTIMVTQLINLQQIAANLNIELEALQDMNPMYRRDVIPGSPEKSYPVRIPVELVSDFILQSDTIYKHDRNVHFPGNTVVTPQTSAGSSEERYTPSLEGKTKILYTVKKGDNPGFIAGWYDVPVNDLKNWNNIRKNMIKVGQKLAVYVPEEKSDYYKKINNLSFSAKQSLSGKQIPANAVASSSAAAEAGSEPAVASVSGGFEYYTVRKGDNLWTIARKYPGISNQDIMKLNNITDVKGLRAGQKLKIRPKS